MTASAVPAPAPAKSLSDRVAYAFHPSFQSRPPLTEGSANPKAQPKSAVADNRKANATDKKGRGRPKKGGRTARPKPKSTQELDQEMADYFGEGGNGGNTGVNGNGGAEATAGNGGGDAMDEIS